MDPSPPPAPVIQSLFSLPAGLEKVPSPGAIQGCRIAAVALSPTAAAQDEDSYASVFASSSKVYFHSVRAPRRLAGSAGKEGVMTPLRVEATPAACVALTALRHAGEVQGVAARPCADGVGVLVATVDAYGCGTLSRLTFEPVIDSMIADNDQQQQAGARENDTPLLQPAVAAAVAGVARLEPANAAAEAGWAGVAFSRGSAARFALARGYTRDVALYDGATRQRTLHAVTPPYALSFLGSGGGGDCGGSSGDVLALAEGHILSVWDARAGERGGCVHRFAAAAAGTPIHALEWCAARGGLLGAAGADRALQMVDPRRWRCVERWAGATRQAAQAACFLDSAPGYACVASVDGEVVCGEIGRPPPPVAVKPYTIAEVPQQQQQQQQQPQHEQQQQRRQHHKHEQQHSGPAFAFRGDARWLGVSRAEGDVLAAFGALGRITYARLARADDTAAVAVE